MTDHYDVTFIGAGGGTLVYELAGVANRCRSVRSGEDSKTSALDIHCKAHDLDNLYVVGASFFVSSGAVNPSLTLIANALRVGDHLRERMS